MPDADSRPRFERTWETSLQTQAELLRARLLWVVARDDYNISEAGSV